MREITPNTLFGKKLYFLHIPKTAGTSVSSMLSEVARENSLTYRGPLLLDHLKKLPDWKEIDILAGHLGRLPIRHNFEYFTIIREPIERLFSYYSHVKRDSGHYFNKLVLEENLSFEGWLRDPRTRNLNYNMQSRYLSSIPRLKIQNEGVAEWSIQKKYENQTRFKVSLKKALRTLNGAIWYGTPNDLGYLQVFLSSAYRISHLEIPRINTNSTPRNEFSSSEILAAEPLIEFDRVLYHEALGRSLNTDNY